jgi:hypothetical protein
MADNLGASHALVQSVELSRLALSERLAFRLSHISSVPVERILRNDLRKPLPDSAEMRKHFEATVRYCDSPAGGKPCIDWKKAWDLDHLVYLEPRMVLMNILVLQKEIVSQLHHDGGLGPEPWNILQKATLRMLALIKDKKTRRATYQRARDLVTQGAEKVLASHLADTQEMLRALRDIKAKKRAAIERAVARWKAKQAAEANSQGSQSDAL